MTRTICWDAGDLVMMNKELQYIQHSQSHLCGQVGLDVCGTQAVSILDSSIFEKKKKKNKIKCLRSSLTDLHPS